MWKSMIRLVAQAMVLVATTAALADVVHTNPEPDPAFPRDPEYLGIDLDANGVSDFALDYDILPPNCPIPEGCPTWGQARARSLQPLGNAWMTTTRLRIGMLEGVGRTSVVSDAVFNHFLSSGSLRAGAESASYFACHSARFVS